MNNLEQNETLLTIVNTLLLQMDSQFIENWDICEGTVKIFEQFQEELNTKVETKDTSSIDINSLILIMFSLITTSILLGNDSREKIRRINDRIGECRNFRFR